MTPADSLSQITIFQNMVIRVFCNQKCVFNLKKTICKVNVEQEVNSLLFYYIPARSPTPPPHSRCPAPLLTPPNILRHAPRFKMEAHMKMTAAFYENMKIVFTKSATKGHIIPPILAMHEQDPMPAFLTTVGNSSAEYWYTRANPQAAPSLPTKARARLAELVSRTYPNILELYIITLQFISAARKPYLLCNCQSISLLYKAEKIYENDVCK